MDEVDLTIINMLWMNSRVPLRELADKLDLSVNSVHKRINNLVDQGVIEQFCMTPNLHPDSVSIIIIGKSNSPSLEKAINDLGKTRNVEKAMSGLDNWIMMSVHLKKISEMNAFTEQAVRELALKNYIVGLFTCDDQKTEPVPLTKQDYQIFNSMAQNSRKSISDVAEELGVSPKTVKRRLTKMEKMIYAGINWQPTMSNDIISYMLLTLKPGVTRQEIIADLHNEYKPNMMQHHEFSNLPDFLIAIFWGKTMREINDIQQRLKDSGRFKSITANVQYKAYHFDTWAHEHVRKMATGNE
jgi:DNA-binding Lrp family transcriptional regulator